MHKNKVLKLAAAKWEKNNILNKMYCEIIP
jgi:hypothetical protein